MSTLGAVHPSIAAFVVPTDHRIILTEDQWVNLKSDLILCDPKQIESIYEALFKLIPHLSHDK